MAGTPSGREVDELEALGVRERELEKRLQELKTQIEQAEHGVGQERRVASVDTSRCTGCGMCLEICPAGAVTVRGTAAVRVDRCTGCGRCVQMCSRRAITLKYPGQTG